MRGTARVPRRGLTASRWTFFMVLRASSKTTPRSRPLCQSPTFDLDCPVRSAPPGGQHLLSQALSELVTLIERWRATRSFDEFRPCAHVGTFQVNKDGTVPGNAIRSNW